MTAELRDLEDPRAREIEVFRTPVLPREGRRGVLTQVVRQQNLRPVADREPLGTYLATLWQRRYFIVTDARARVVSGTRGNLLGTAWLTLRPALDGAVYIVIFGVLLHVSRGIDNFLGYALIGVFVFGFTTQCVTSGASSLLKGNALVRSFAFPRAALPIAVVMREAISFLPALGAMFILVLTIPPAEIITWRVILVPVILALQLMLNLGLALIAARMTARVPDLQQVIGIFTRFWLYGSAVFFSYERFIHHPLVLDIVRLNPMFVVLDMVRDCLLYGASPDLRSWVTLAMWSFLGLGFGMVWFWQGEERYGSA